MAAQWKRCANECVGWKATKGNRATRLGSEHKRIKGLERENSELKLANEILCKTAAFFA